MTSFPIPDRLRPVPRRTRRQACLACIFVSAAGATLAQIPATAPQSEQRPVGPAGQTARSVIVDLPESQRPFAALTRIDEVGTRLVKNAAAVKDKVTRTRDAYVAQPSPETESQLFESMSEGMTDLMGDYLELAESATPALAEAKQALDDFAVIEREVGGMVARQVASRENSERRQEEVTTSMRQMVERLRRRGLLVTLDTAGVKALPPEVFAVLSGLGKALEEAKSGSVNSEAMKKAFEASLEDLERAKRHVEGHRKRLAEMQELAFDAARGLGRDAKEYVDLCAARQHVFAKEELIKKLARFAEQYPQIQTVCASSRLDPPALAGSRVAPADDTSWETGVHERLSVTIRAVVGDQIAIPAPSSDVSATVARGGPATASRSPTNSKEPVAKSDRKEDPKP